MISQNLKLLLLSRLDFSADITWLAQERDVSNPLLFDTTPVIVVGVDGFDGFDGFDVEIDVGFGLELVLFDGGELLWENVEESGSFIMEVEEWVSKDDGDLR